MDLKYFMKHYHELLAYLREQEYSGAYIAHFQTEINWILSHADGNCWNSYQDIFFDRTAGVSSKQVLRQKRGLIGALELFDIHHAFPDGHRKNALFPRGAYHLLLPEYQELIDFYRNAEEKRGKKASTIHHEALNTASFLYDMQVKGCRSLSEITEDAAISFFRSQDGQFIKSCSYRKNISAVFKAGLSWKEQECRRILLCLPMLREKRQNIQYLTDMEISALMDTLRNGGNCISHRNKAIMLLLFFTGLRGCDIAAIRLDCIDWENEKIVIPQQKTGIPLELPLTPLIGNTVYDYLSMERPNIPDGHLFLTESRRPHSLGAKSVGNIVAKVFRSTGIRQEPGSRKGTHIFRHNLAASLLENGIPRPVISQTLGHTAPDSLEPYLRADFVHLKECALSIEAFPVTEEVFSL